MAQNHSLSLLVAAMDGLWFNQVILFSNPMSLLSPTTLRIAPQTTSSDSLLYCLSDLSAPPPSEEETSAYLSASPLPQLVDEEDDPKNQGEDKEMKQKERPNRYLGAVTSLPKTMSCKSLRELELEEVKGFMDLGFKFKREHLSPRMITVIPGLQRLGGYNNEQETELSDSTQSANYKDDKIEEEEEEERAVVRPYLSEAWLIKRPDSPLLNLKMPRVSASADMKKHLWHWARTVAYVIQQQS
ncbi:uncharacterized protein LOC100854914 isoform X2 [Vitis vinifera]|uniref:uncharacterized protein LOC100854914 isoform X2 n=1 Tax=Vitis vinifera TaxID=29760 RepID=UPI00053F524D|nr:uncharacterized protein LOC100854914 isoform X2 [Vitis vinifera]|eukprot:XP_010653545.1 PREDICTED: uncharacterized protein LOC100854914 isoform X2 [Vitis vinifera]